MISVINGTILHKENLDVGFCVDVLTSSGVGYKIIIHDDIKKNDEVLFYLVSSYDTNGVLTKIYGYGTPESRKVHEILTNIQGLGSSHAFNLLSLGVERLIESLSLQDENSLRKIKGVGPKLIQKIFSYYQEKINSFPIRSMQYLNDNYEPSRQEIQTLGSICGVSDNNLLSNALKLARLEGAEGSILYREAVKIITSRKV